MNGFHCTCIFALKGLSAVFSLEDASVFNVKDFELSVWVFSGCGLWVHKYVFYDVVQHSSLYVCVLVGFQVWAQYVMMGMIHVSGSVQRVCRVIPLKLSSPAI